MQKPREDVTHPSTKRTFVKQILKQETNFHRLSITFFDYEIYPLIIFVYLRYFLTFVGFGI
jgi:hypothetical protein